MHIGYIGTGAMMTEHKRRPVPLESGSFISDAAKRHKTESSISRKVVTSLFTWNSWILNLWAITCSREPKHGYLYAFGQMFKIPVGDGFPETGILNKNLF